LGSLLDTALPTFDVRERHEIWVPAAQQDAYAAVTAVSAPEVRLLRPLMRLRTFGRRWARARPPDAPVLDQMLAIGFTQLGERPDEEIVVGAIGRFWSPTGNRPRSADDFEAFDEPGYAKAAMNFTVRREGEGCRITTETRIVGTDAEATRKFRLYWLAIRPGSGAIRRSWLKAIRRRLERTTPENVRAEP
jgi:hypothetical protein